MPTKPPTSGMAFSLVFAIVAVVALAGTIYVTASGQYTAAATVLGAGVTLGLAFVAAVPWFPSRSE